MSAIAIGMLLISFVLAVGAILPASAQIAYVSGNEVGLGDIYLLDIERTISLKLTSATPNPDTVEVYIRPQWSSDGQRLFAIGQVEDTYEFFELNFAIKQPKRVLDPSLDGVSGVPSSLSPNGQYIVYSDYLTMLVNIAERSYRKLEKLAVGNMAWSPDSQRLAFTTSPEEGQIPLVIINAQTGEVVQKTYIGWQIAGMSWSPDGSLILYSDHAGPDSPNLYDIYTVEVSIGFISQLTESPDDDYHAVWSPDGHQIAFVSQRDGDDDIYVMNADGSEVRALTHNTTSEMYPVWSEDGQRIVFQSLYDYGLYIINVDGSNLRRLTDDNRSGWQAAWRPCAC